MSFANKSEEREEKYDLTMTCWQDMQMEMKMEMEIGDAYVYMNWSWYNVDIRPVLDSCLHCIVSSS